MGSVRSMRILPPRARYTHTRQQHTSNNQKCVATFCFQKQKKKCFMVLGLRPRQPCVSMAKINAPTFWAKCGCINNGSRQTGKGNGQNVEPCGLMSGVRSVARAICTISHFQLIAVSSISWRKYSNNVQRNSLLILIVFYRKTPTSFCLLFWNVR